MQTTQERLTTISKLQLIMIQEEFLLSSDRYHHKLKSNSFTNIEKRFFLNLSAALLWSVVKYEAPAIYKKDILNDCTKFEIDEQNMILILDEQIEHLPSLLYGYLAEKGKTANFISKLMESVEKTEEESEAMIGYCKEVILPLIKYIKECNRRNRFDKPPVMVYLKDLK